MKPGIYRGMSFADYLNVPAVNKSNLDWMRYSPQHYFAHCEADDRPERDEPTPAMKLGTAIHTAVLEPALFTSRYGMVPANAPKKPSKTQLEAKKPSAETMAAIEWWEAFSKATEKLEILSAENWELCKRVRAEFMKSTVAQALLEGGETEIVIVWEDPIEELLCKARIDLLSEVILDIKSTISARADEFAKQVVNQEWHVQAAFYSDGYKLATGKEKTFVFGALEKEVPFASAFYFVPPRAIELGREIYRRRLKRVAECRRTGEWPGYNAQLTELTLPTWAEKELTHDLAANDI